jgi:hypothetical protein
MSFPKYFCYCNLVAVKLKGSVSLISQLTIGDDSELCPSISHPHNLFLYDSSSRYHHISLSVF